MTKCYPLGEHARDEIRTRTGKKLDDLTLERLRAGEVGPEDLTIHPDTLRA